MEKIQFKISSALKDLVGKDLIRDEKIAIFELVKNSYDAFATKVEITFEANKIIIADNGKGMNIEDIKNKWLFLAYSAKKDGTEDKKQESYRDQIKRHYAGAKGIGRFSCDRLGSKLILTTKSIESKEVEQLFIDWSDFEQNQNNKFEEISVIHNSLNNKIVFPDNNDTGTILEITNLHLKWERNRILDLKHSLEKLINPFSEKIDFSIEIICKSEINKDKELTNQKVHIRNIVNGVVSNSISQILNIKTTKIDVNLTPNYIETSLYDRGTEIYKIREKNKFDKLNSVTINLYYLNKVAKNSFTAKMGIQPINYGSIFLFRNGFRILPFGNKGDDSWELDYRAQQGRKRYIGTRDLFGRVDIQTDNIEEFKEVSSRDGGLIKSETTLQLKRLFEIVHHRLERYVTGVLWGEGFLKRQYFNNISLVEKNRNLLAKDKDLDSIDYIIKSSLGSKIDFIQLIKTLINDKDIEVIYYNKDLSNIFSEPKLFKDANPQTILNLEQIAEKTNDSNLIASIDKAKQQILELQKQKNEAEKKSEELDIIVNQAEKEKKQAQYEASVAKVKQLKTEKENINLRQNIDRINSENLFLVSDVNKDVKQLSSLQHHITHTSSFIHELALKALDAINNNENEKAINLIKDILFENTKIATLSNFVSKAKFNLKVKKIKKDLVNFINEYMINVYALANDKIHINVNKTSITYCTSFAPIEIIVILDNLIDNSKKAGAKNIYIKWLENDEYYQFIFIDDGNGIKDQNLPKIFDYRFSTTGGGGLGLYHVKEICDKMNITIKVSCNNNITEFIFLFKKG